MIERFVGFINIKLFNKICVVLLEHFFNLYDALNFLFDPFMAISDSGNDFKSFFESGMSVFWLATLNIDVLFLLHIGLELVDLRLPGVENGLSVNEQFLELGVFDAHHI